MTKNALTKDESSNEVEIESLLSRKLSIFLFFDKKFRTYLTLFLDSYSSVNQIAYDWAGGNWYFLDDSKEIIFLCQERKSRAKMMCLSIVSVRLSKPRGIALDPSEGTYS